MGGRAVLDAPGDESGRPLRFGHVNTLPERVAVGAGTALFLDGLCSPQDGPISDLRVSVDGIEHPVLGTATPPLATCDRTDYWWAIVPIEQVDRAQLARLRLHARMGGGHEAVAELGVVELEPAIEVPHAAPSPRTRAASQRGRKQPLIAVCMATWEPPIDLFRRQIDSIREQTYENWICVISDDHSSPQRLAEMREILADDERFSLTPGAERLGCYGNFERALALAPAEAAYIALCDQDDRWYPDKLETLEVSIRSGSKLAYSDMRIVDRKGCVASHTHWTYRRNNHTNFGSLLVANTVTGAASLFARELLEYVLPFPPRHAQTFHDHWIALVALALGVISYVDRPLYDYVQHAAAVVGHEGANVRGWRIPRPGAPAPEVNGGGGVRTLLELLSALGGPQGMRRFYFDHYCGTSITARVVEMRCGPLMARAKRRTVRRFVDPGRATAWLALRSPRRLNGKTETARREQALLAGLVWRHCAEVRKRLKAAGHWLSGPY